MTVRGIAASERLFVNDEPLAIAAPDARAEPQAVERGSRAAAVDQALRDGAIQSSLQSRLGAPRNRILRMPPEHVFTVIDEKGLGDEHRRVYHRARDIAHKAAVRYAADISYVLSRFDALSGATIEKLSRSFDSVLAKTIYEGLRVALTPLTILLSIGKPSADRAFEWLDGRRSLKDQIRAMEGQLAVLRQRVVHHDFGPCLLDPRNLGRLEEIAARSTDPQAALERVVPGLLGFPPDDHPHSPVELLARLIAVVSWASIPGMNVFTHEAKRITPAMEARIMSEARRAARAIFAESRPLRFGRS
jgi:hypothetical protein